MMAQDEAQMPQLQDWERLQAKIFTKWVNQKLMSRHFPTIADVQTDLAKDNTLYNLMCALTEREPPVEKKKPAKMHVKAQVLDDIDKALKFVFDCGIQMKLKPSPENLYSGDFRDVSACCCLFLSVCLFVCHFVCLPVSLSVCLSFCLSVCLSVCYFVCLLFVCLFVCLFVH